ncbi:uncharacterized protein LOC135088819 [Scylla paramamosain]|uniref:uncharacterized protein LOC135088819 n=1 Tax=Scylla paramamosain TaxID=85552 RepID=UPI003082DFD9
MASVWTSPDQIISEKQVSSKTLLQLTGWDHVTLAVFPTGALPSLSLSPAGGTEHLSGRTPPSPSPSIVFKVKDTTPLSSVLSFRRKLDGIASSISTPNAAPPSGGSGSGGERGRCSIGHLVLPGPTPLPGHPITPTLSITDQSLTPHHPCPPYPSALPLSDPSHHPAAPPSLIHPVPSHPPHFPSDTPVKQAIPHPDSQAPLSSTVLTSPFSIIRHPPYPTYSWVKRHLTTAVT